jgi:hypothetical protein
MFYSRGTQSVKFSLQKMLKNCPELNASLQALPYKTLQICNLRQIDSFRNKLVASQWSATNASLDTSLFRNL